MLYRSKNINILFEVFFLAVLPRLLLIVVSLYVFKISFLQYTIARDGSGYIALSNAFSRFDILDVKKFDTRLFPGYPFLMSISGKFIDFGVSGVIISIICAFLACYLYFLIFKDKTTTRFFCLLPPAWLMNTTLVMTEGLSMALILGSLYLFFRNKHISALLIAAFGIIVKPVIVFLFAIYLLFLAKDKSYKKLIFGICLCLLLLYSYMVFCKYTFGDMLINYNIYRHAWSYGSSKIFVLPYADIIKNIFVAGSSFYKIELWKKTYIIFNILFFITGLFFLIRMFKERRDRLSFFSLLWCIVIFIFAGSLGGWSGFHCYDRYILPAMPFLFYSMKDLFPKGNITLFIAFIISIACSLAGNMHSFAIFR
ncbi:MAG: hypothetical protein V2A72_02475 [Candidatus Omnitrophota bacterium]